MWTEIDVSVDDVRFVIDDYTNLIRQNAELRAEIAALLSERTASEAALKEARELIAKKDAALAPFANFASEEVFITDDRWINGAGRERIDNWFGPKAFTDAERAFLAKTGGA